MNRFSNQRIFVFPAASRKQAAGSFLTVFLLGALLVLSVFFLTACLNSGLDNDPKDAPKDDPKDAPKDDPKDSVAPLLESADLNTDGTQITLKFSEEVKETKESLGAFTLGGTFPLTVTSLGIDSGDNRVVILELGSTLESQVQETTLSYNAEEGGITNLTGNALGGFADKAVRDPRPFMLTFLMPENDLNLTIHTTQSISLPDNNDYDINWGDGVIETISGGGDAGPHTYAEAGTYQVRISDSFTQIAMYKGSSFPEARHLRSLDQWGKAHWKNFLEAFRDCTNMTYLATDVPNLSRVTDLHGMFRNVLSVKGDLSQWDIGNVTDAANLFNGVSSFNGDLRQWDTRNVTDMQSMLASTNFSGDISGWDVGKVENMAYMFFDSDSFDRDISDWNVENVKNMSFMFWNATSFNRDISDWNVENVTDMNLMFWNAASFNRDISGWNVKKVTNMADMFLNADDFNQNLGPWYITLNKETLSLADTGGNITLGAQNSSLSGHLDSTAPYTLISVDGVSYDAGDSDFALSGKVLTYTGTDKGEYVLEFGGTPASGVTLYGSAPTAAFTITITD